MKTQREGYERSKLKSILRKMNVEEEEKSEKGDEITNWECMRKENTSH